jgi:hypothetical protein
LGIIIAGISSRHFLDHSLTGPISFGILVRTAYKYSRQSLMSLMMDAWVILGTFRAKGLIRSSPIFLAREKRRGRVAPANPALVLAMAHVENIVHGLDRPGPSVCLET